MLTVESIKRAEEFTYAVFDDVVTQALDIQEDTCVQELSTRWRDLDPKGWHSRRYARNWAKMWLRAAVGRGELVAFRKDEDETGRMYYRRPDDWGAL